MAASVEETSLFMGVGTGWRGWIVAWIGGGASGLAGAGTETLMGRISICLMRRENDQVSLSHGRAGCGSPRSLLIRSLASEKFGEERMLVLVLLLWCSGKV